MLNIVGFCFILAPWFVSANEPQCYSRFDYEYKVVQKIFELENSQKQHFEKINALEHELSNFKTESQEELTKLEDANVKLTATLEDMNKRIENLTTQVQNIKESNNPPTVRCQDKTTGWNVDGKGDARYLDRHHVRCDQQNFLSYFRLQRNSEDRSQFRFIFSCCSLV